MIKHISKYNAQYFQLYIPCPVCLSNARPTSAVYWTHEQCGGDMYIGDDGYCYCESCGERKPAIQWTYRCVDCVPGTTGVNSMKIDGQKHPAEIISISGQLSSETGIIWLNKFITAIMKQCSDDYEI